MYFSKFNIFSKIRDSENYYLVNPLVGSADIVDPETARQIMDGTFRDEEEFIEKGYLIDEEVEQKLFREKYLDFLDRRDRSEVQIFFVPNYSCNFSCSYCYQKEYETEDVQCSTEVIDGFFTFIGKKFFNRNAYCTLFGGEPLLGGRGFRDRIDYFLSQARTNGFETAIVTNGYNLVEYMDILAGGLIREVQVTLDTTEQIHNKRRPLKNGGETFRRIVEGIDSALGAGLTINLRVVLDAENMHFLPELASFAIEKGWTENPGFKTQLGRNYELHSCQTGNDRLYSRVAFYEKLYELILEHPEVTVFHRPSYSLTRFLFDNGELPDPLFDACPACKTEWAFDYTGRIYPCTATVGKADESLGRFFPKVALDAEKIDLWEMRDVTTIELCSTCNLRLVCGGGCGAVAKNRNGSVGSPDCRPEKELIEMGMALYFERGVL